ncbi:MAG: ABC transporter ATP-binding protein [Lachnospiraceae bacterium]|uniref:ABC transporter ATP-binding protein n=1 Tax=Roseburia hominis TaxID=301301 RepID=UPI001F46FBC6|nr:ABC transporter ATP-binding protein [Roseburia hominis]MCI5711769.1 ABC transporter ATP-binding protein/permease [Lachnospiraceae bacterium]MDD6168776.1 ABC transporter ATP-binding protein [Lachnospiraceae bacterium]
MAVNSYKDDEQMEKEKSKTATLKRLFSYLLAYKGQILIVLLLLLYGVVISLINPILIEDAIDVYIKNSNIPGLFRFIGIALIANVLVVVAMKVRMYIMAKVCNSILLTIRQQLYTHIQKLDFQFFDSRPTGKILSRIIGDINSLKDVLSNSVTTLIPDMVTVIAVVVIMFSKNAKLAAAALISTPLMVFGVAFIETHAHPRWQTFRKKSSNLNAFIHEDMSGMRIIKSFTAEEETRDTFDELIAEHKKSFLSAVRFSDAFGSVIDFSWGLGCICLYFVGIVILGADNVTLGTFLAFGTYINMFWQPINNLSDFYNQLVTNIAGAERVFEILDTKPAIADEEGVTTMPEIKGNVRFEHVSFSYDENTKVLDDINFDIKPGETIALVGATGSGKSTIVNLISRFYDVQSGKVLIDGIDVKKVSIESLRKQMGIMTQDNFLFSGTIKDNIRYGRLDATDEEIIAAAKAVNAHDFIMNLEKGYDTELSERGGGLSIGQKQLLAFARTMVSMPKILILDEATSSIDTQTEILVQKGIKSLLKGRTSFIIAHRLSTIQEADRIFVIDDGHIIEQGSAEELMKLKGAYYKLYMAQFAA